MGLISNIFSKIAPEPTLGIKIIPEEPMAYDANSLAGKLEVTNISENPLIITRLEATFYPSSAEQDESWYIRNFISDQKIPVNVSINPGSTEILPFIIDVKYPNGGPDNNTNLTYRYLLINAYSDKKHACGTGVDVSVQYPGKTPSPSKVNEQGGDK